MIECSGRPRKRHYTVGDICVKAERRPAMLFGAMQAIRIPERLDTPDPNNDRISFQGIRRGFNTT